MSEIDSRGNRPLEPNGPGEDAASEEYVLGLLRPALQTRDTSPAGPERLPFQWANLTVLSKARSGAYGDVHPAHDHDLDCTVALKLYHDRPADG